MYLRQYTPITDVLGAFVDDTDGKTFENGLSLTIQLYKNNDLPVSRHCATEIGPGTNGNYRVAYDKDDIDQVGRLRICGTAAGALPVWKDFTVLDPVSYDKFMKKHVGVMQAAQIAGEL